MPRILTRAGLLAASLAASTLPSIALALGCATNGNPISLDRPGLGPLALAVSPGSSSNGTAFFAINAKGNAQSNVTVEFRIPADAGLAFVDAKGVPFPDPLRVRVTSSNSCTAGLPRILAAPGARSGYMEGRFVYRPDTSGETLDDPIAIPITAVTNPPITSVGGRLAFEIAAAGAQMASRGASLSWQFGGLGGRTVVFATDPPGLATFPNGQDTIGVATDPFGHAETPLTLKTVPASGLTLYAQSEDGRRAPLARYFPTSAVTISPPEAPVRVDYGDSSVLFEAKLAAFPCPAPSDGATMDLEGRFVIADGNAVTPVYTSACGAPAWIETYLDHLEPGVHELRAGFRGATHPTVYSPAVTVEVRPRAVVNSAVGSAKLSLGNAGEHDNGSFKCTLANARTGLAGDPGMPASLPSGLAAPWGLVHFDLAGCYWQSGWTLPPPAPPMTQRIVVVSDVGLPGNASVWVHGTWSDSYPQVPEWREIPATLGAKSATFQITGNSSPTVAIGVRSSDPPNYQDLWWAGPQENGWGLSITQHGDRMFGAFFIYDEAGAPRWIVMSGGAWDAGKRVFTGSLYRPEGSPYYAYDVSKFRVGTPIGTAQLEFTALDAMTLRYTMDGVSGEKRLSRMLFGPKPVLPSVPQDGLWWGGESQNGWGISMHQQGNNVFAIWFVYGADGKTTWFFASSALLYEPDKQFSAVVYRARGSPWLGTPYDPAKLKVEVVGSMRFMVPGQAFLVGPEGTMIKDIELMPF